MTRLLRTGLTLGIFFGIAAQPVGAQQFSYQFVGPASVPVGAVVDVSVFASFSSPPQSTLVQGIFLDPAFTIDGSPETINQQAFCQQGSIIYTPGGNEPVNVALELCRYRFRGVNSTAGAVILLSGMQGPLIQVGSTTAPPALIYNPAAGATIAYSANGAGPSIAVSNGGGGSGSGAAATTTVGGCIISNGGAAFPVTQFNPAIAATGTAAPQPQAIVLPACVPLGTPTVAQLRCTETSGTAAPINRTWSLNCPVMATSQVATPPEIESQSLSGGLPDAPSSAPVLSGNGLQLAYASAATNIVAGDTNSGDDIFLRDRIAGTTIRVSAVAEALNPGNPESYTEPAISRQGGRVAFTGASSGQIYVAIDGVGRVLSRSAAGAPGNGRSGKPHLPGAGALAFFHSEASNLLPGVDGNGSISDIFMTDLGTGTVTLISRGPNGEPADGPSIAPRASDNGEFVAFSTRASNLVAGTPTSAPGAEASEVLQATVANRSGRGTIYLSRNRTNGQLGNGDSINVSLASDGRRGVFESIASNLIAGDTNNVRDIFLFEHDGVVLTRLDRISVSRLGAQANGASSNAIISGDGQFVFFQTEASNLVDLDQNGTTDVLRKSVATGEIVRISQSGAVEPNGPSVEASASDNGMVAAFGSGASNLIPGGDTNGAQDIFSTQLISAGAQDEPRLAQYVLPIPNPANPNCPAGFFSALVDDGPGAGLTAGAFGVELLLDAPGTRVLAGGLNFGGLIDTGQVGFAAFNIANTANESQRLNLTLSGSPASSSTANIPVRIRIGRRPDANSNISVFETTATISLTNPFLTSIDLPPAFYEATVAPISGSAGGPPEGQFFFSLTTSFINRPGGGFQGGAVVGGYHAAHPFGGVSGFAAFCLATPHTTTIRVLSRPSYGPTGAQDLRLRIKDALRRDVVVVPGG